MIRLLDPRVSYEDPFATTTHVLVFVDAYLCSFKIDLILWNKLETSMRTFTHNPLEINLIKTCILFIFKF